MNPCSSFSRVKAAVLEDALDGVEDSPMLSTESSRASPSNSGGGGASGDGGSDRGVQRLESLRELLAAALYHRPDLPLGLCVKSELGKRNEWGRDGVPDA